MRPLAGIVEATRPGLGVEENASLLRRFIHVEERLCLLLAGHLPAVPQMAAKQGHGRHLWEDAEHAAWLRDRVPQLRTSAKVLDDSPDPALTRLLAEALWASDAEEVLVAVYGVIKPALIGAYRWHLATTNPLVDFPTARLLRFILAEEEEQVGWGADALQALPSSAALAEWESTLRALLAAAGGISGREERRGYNGALRSAAGKPNLPMYPARDAGKPTQFDVPKLADPDGVEARLLQKMLVRYNEMKAVENIAATMYETDGMPWEFYHELARHLWDEVRHCCFGEVMVGHLGCDVGEFPFAVGNSVFYSMLDPIPRYALLGISIEGGAMKYPPGKRLEYEWCRDVARHSLATVFQDYDWADEVLHTQIARKWLGYQLGGDLAEARQIAAKAKEALVQFRAVQEEAEAERVLLLTATAGDPPVEEE